MTFFYFLELEEGKRKNRSQKQKREGTRIYGIFKVNYLFKLKKVFFLIAELEFYRYQEEKR